MVITIYIPLQHNYFNPSDLRPPPLRQGRNIFSLSKHLTRVIWASKSGALSHFLVISTTWGYLKTILEIIGYFNLPRPSAMPSGTTLKTPPSLRDTSSINRGGLKSFCSSFILIANAVLFGRAKPGRSHISLSYRPHGRYLKTILEIIGYFNLLSPSAMPSGTTLKTPPSLRDTSSINRGGLKSSILSYIYISNLISIKNLSAPHAKRKACANERNVKPALTFYSKCNQGSLKATPHSGEE